MLQCNIDFDRFTQLRSFASLVLVETHTLVHRTWGLKEILIRLAIMMKIFLSKTQRTAMLPTNLIWEKILWTSKTNVNRRFRTHRISGTLTCGIARCWFPMMICEANWMPAMLTLCPSFDHIDFSTLTPSFTSESGPIGSSCPSSSDTLIVTGTSSDAEVLNSWARSAPTSCFPVK